MLSVSQLAKQHNLSRTTILYYEKKGLLLPLTRSANGYRWYGGKECERLQEIIAYRSFGVPISKMTMMLDSKDDFEQEQILKEQFNSLEDEINRLRQQQKAIITLLQSPDLIINNKFNKEQWVAIMKAAGLDDDDMKNWHIKFESMRPDAHQEFLESLSIDADEIKDIRKWSKSNQNKTR